MDIGAPLSALFIYCTVISPLYSRRFLEIVHSFLTLGKYPGENYPIVTIVQKNAIRNDLMMTIVVVVISSFLAVNIFFARICSYRLQHCIVHMRSAAKNR